MIGLRGLCVVAVMVVVLTVLAHPRARGQEQPLRISELVAANVAGLQDEDGDYSDWVEIWNPNPEARSLDGWALTDDADEPRKWRFPNIAVAAGEYLIVFASGKDRNPLSGGEQHSNFRLDADGEYLALTYGPDEFTVEVVDSVEFPKQRSGYAYGLWDGSSGYRYLDPPTPGAANNASTSYAGLLDPPGFSVSRGIYEVPFQLVLTAASAENTIHYTLDGREPDGDSPPYGAPLTIDANTVVRARTFREDWRPSAVNTHTYVLETDELSGDVAVWSIVGDPEQSLYEPNGVMAIVGGAYDDEGFWYATGVGDYNNAIQRGREYERPVSFEILTPGGVNGEQVDCGIRVQGSTYHRYHYRRGEDWSICDYPEQYSKFSFKLYFRDEYGDAWLDYPAIPDAQAGRFQVITLRGGTGDFCSPFIKDELFRRLHQDMGRFASRGTFAQVLINGEYKAYYNPCEHIHEEALQEWYDSDADWDVITQSNYWEFDDPRDGDTLFLDALLDYAQTHDLAHPPYYDEFANRFDVAAFADYLILELYSGNYDWPDNNYTMARERSDQGQLRFYLWDMEATLEGFLLDLNPFVESPRVPLNDGTGFVADFFRALRENPDFRQLFGDRAQRHFFNGGALTPGNIRARYDELRDETASLVPDPGGFISDTWIPSRQAVVLEAFVSQGLFTFNGPVFTIDGAQQQGGYVSTGELLGLETDQPRGDAVYFTLDGTDPRMPRASALGTVWIDDASMVGAYVPENDIGSAWIDGSSFDDAVWLTGQGGVGYEESTGYEPYIGLDVGEDMPGVRTSCYIRIPFEVTADELARFDEAILHVQYDDGFAAYINGQLVAQANAPESLAWDSAATGQHVDNEALVAEPFDVTPSLATLRAGENMLAIHGLNADVGSSDFLIRAALWGGETLPEGQASATAMIYTEPMAVTATTEVRARTLRQGQWSALSEALFTVDSARDALRVTELMYNPPGDPDQTEEFIELLNTGSDVLVLAGLRLTDGIAFTFPDIALGAGEYVVVVSDEEAFAARYGVGIPIAGEYTGSLRNSGERITLEDAVGGIIADFEFRDDWVASTDGGGDSLTFCNALQCPADAWSDAVSWCASSAPGGSPGYADPGIAVDESECRSSLSASDLALSTNNITLTPTAPASEFGIENLGEAALQWTAQWDGNSITLSQDAGSGAAVVTVTAVDLSRNATVPVTITNAEDPEDREILTVEIVAAATPPGCHAGNRGAGAAHPRGSVLGMLILASLLAGAARVHDGHQR